MRRSLLAVAVVVLALPASGASMPVANQSASQIVRVGDFFFRNPYVRIEPGDSVTWRFVSGPHTATSRAGAPEAFDSGEQLPGAQYVRAFGVAGRYRYHCTIHPEMRGVVQVGPDTIDPKLEQPKAKRGKTSVRVSFRLSEGAKVSASLASKAKPKQKLRKAKARQLEEGRRSISVKMTGLEPGRYRVTVSAKDPEGNVGTAKAAFKIPQP